MEHLFLALLVIIMIAALASGFPVAFALPGSAIISIGLAALFGPNVAFFGSKVTNNLINLLNSLGEQGVAALIIVFAVIFVYRKYLK